MADLISDGKIRVYWVPGTGGIANKSAPTVAELNAGTRLDVVMTPDGLDLSFATAAVDNSSLSSTFDTEKAGRRKPSGKLTIKRQDGTDTIFALLAYQSEGFLAIRRNIDASTAWTIAQKAEVYPAQTGMRSQGYGPNTIQRYDVPLFFTSDPDDFATVA
jgi:hypothetical protein